MKERLLHSCLPALLATLTACSSTPATHYYVLDSDKALVPPAAMGEVASRLTLGIAPVSLSQYLARINLTLKKDHLVEISEYHHWAEPLDDGIQRVLIENLSAQLSPDQLKKFPWRADERPDYQLRVQLLELNRSDDHAVLKANWRIVARGSGTPCASGQADYRLLISGDSHQALVAGYSALLGRLGNEIGGQLLAASARHSGGTR